MNQILVRDGKGAKDRVTMLPGVARDALSQQLQRAHRQHQADLARGAGWVELPYTHVLNRGPAGVTSPADRLLGP